MTLTLRQADLETFDPCTPAMFTLISGIQAIIDEFKVGTLHTVYVCVMPLLTGRACCRQPGLACGAAVRRTGVRDGSGPAVDDVQSGLLLILRFPCVCFDV